MTTISYQGYDERDYLEDPYLTYLALAATGMQCQAVINATVPQGMQTRRVIEALSANAMQARADIAGFIASYGMQSRMVINDDMPIGTETHSIINTTNARGMQAHPTILYQTPNGMQTHRVIQALVPQGMQIHRIIQATTASGMQTRRVIQPSNAIGFQTRRIINDDVSLGMQTRRIILDFARACGMQTRRVIANNPKIKGMEALSTKLTHLLTGSYLTTPYLMDPYLTGLMQAILGVQTRRIINATTATGMQTRRVIAANPAKGMQTRRVIKDFLDANGMQALAVHVFEVGMQCFSSLYNTNNLRIMASFPSRGTTGLNWVSNSTEPGDFDSNNLNTDLDEQVWRSATGTTTSIIVQCDTQIPQGVFLDTLCIRNHNLTSSAALFIQGSNDATFMTVGTTIPLQITPDHIYYIAADVPNFGYRYWRFLIDDNSNPDNFCRMGTVLFGRADIFQGECHTDEVSYGYRDFVDSVQTEGFTNVSNSRALKKVLNLDFRYLRYNLGNFRILRSIHTVYRTTHKVLWIPTPDPVDQTITARFAVYGKLSAIPPETHNYKGANADYVTLAVEVDESK